ncbi:hypothetical protein E3C22_22135 [Jiella endophytica]|uniref:Uncharacterized protein n=1 Tax=Jiella endophytica TaxID=2558362 RepID=A0A4Y8R9C7_9HYPH|nr:hypothetical protein [Jiella endophytica]TFF18254.1 hypothetical protein E3C22_22135 [Jiella endophytica]
MMVIDRNIQELLGDLAGHRCSRKRAGNDRSMSIGFGELSSHPIRSEPSQFYANWEVGTFSAAWRVVKGEKIILGSMSPVDNAGEINERFNQVSIGGVERIEQISKYDISVLCEENIRVDFLCASDYQDDMFHVFAPDNLYIGYSVFYGWRHGPSNEPWLADLGRLE